MTCPSAHDLFRAAMRNRRANHPLYRVSAYKVRESRDNLHHNLRTVGSIAVYFCARPCDRYASLLLGCTPEDKADRLRRVPAIIARELGHNLIPALEALTNEGVPATDIADFLLTLRPRVSHLLHQCTSVQAGMARSISHEYAALRAGHSAMLRLCEDALDIAEAAVSFCKLHGVLPG